jgi:hypothetical protein
MCSTEMQLFFYAIAEKFDAFVQFWYELEKLHRDLHYTFRFSNIYE